MKRIKTYKLFEGNFDELHQTRSELVNKIKQDCAPFLELSKTCEHPLVFLRGTSEEWLESKDPGLFFRDPEESEEN